MISSITRRFCSAIPRPACRSDGVAALAQAGERGPGRVRQPAGGGDKQAPSLAGTESGRRGAG